MKTITIIGGGLAGLALGIGLRRHDVPVKLIEAGTYPRHRVCGEFVSGRGLNCFGVLGVSEVIEQASSQEASDAAFFTSGSRVVKQPLPAKALCISRFVLDAALARAFHQTGGQLYSGQRWHGEPNEGTVFATGRRRHLPEGGFHWVGVKAHACGVSLETDLEMHVHAAGYVGLCRLPAGKVNVCGLFRQLRGAPANGDIFARLRGPKKSLLETRLATADFAPESVCTVAGLSFRPARMKDAGCRIGDAWTMIPPVTGNGMSIAFESAALALGPLLDYARGHRTWVEANKRINDLLSARLSRRLFWAGLLHKVMFSRLEKLSLALFRMPPVWRAAFDLTR